MTSDFLFPYIHTYKEIKEMHIYLSKFLLSICQLLFVARYFPFQLLVVILLRINVIVCTLLISNKTLQFHQNWAATYRTV